MRRREFLGLAVTAVALPGVGILRVSAQDADLEATVHALETEIAALQTQVAVGESSGETPTASAGVLYEADWSNGIEDWRGDLSWTTLEGMLVNTDPEGQDEALFGGGAGAFSGMIFAPYSTEPGASFAVEAEMQYLDPIGDIGGLGIFARAQREGAYCAGYFSGNSFEQNHDLFITNRHEIDNLVPNFDDPYTQFTVDNEWHTYRLEISGMDLTLLLDGRVAVEDQDAEFLQGTGLGIWSTQYQVVVRSFKVLSL